MNGRTHLILGLASGVAVAAASPSFGPPLYDLAGKAGVVLLAGICSLIPDIDHPKSIISGWLPGVGGAVRVFTSHRTWTHSLIFALAIIFAAWVPSRDTTPAVFNAAALGVISHLVADMLTPAGVPLLLPISRRSFRLAPYNVLWHTSWLLEATATVGAMALIGFTVVRSV